MNKLFYLDTKGDYHSFELENNTLKDIIQEFKSIGDYLRSLGIKFKVCGTRGEYISR